MVLSPIYVLSIFTSWCPNFFWLLAFDVQLLLFPAVQMVLHWNRRVHGVEHVLRGWVLFCAEGEGLMWRWLEAIDGTINGLGNPCVLTQFQKWSGSWRFVLLFLRRSVGADVAAPAESFYSLLPCILSKLWSNCCLTHASLVLVPCCIAIFALSDKHFWCAGLSLISMVLLRYFWNRSHMR